MRSEFCVESAETKQKNNWLTSTFSLPLCPRIRLHHLQNMRTHRIMGTIKPCIVNEILLHPHENYNSQVCTFHLSRIIYGEGIYLLSGYFQRLI